MEYRLNETLQEAERSGNTELIMQRKEMNNQNLRKEQARKLEFLDKATADIDDATATGRAVGPSGGRSRDRDSRSASRGGRSGDNAISGASSASRLMGRARPESRMTRGGGRDSSMLTSHETRSMYAVKRPATAGTSRPGGGGGGGGDDDDYDDLDDAGVYEDSDTRLHVADHYDEEWMNGLGPRRRPQTAAGGTPQRRPMSSAELAQEVNRGAIDDRVNAVDDYVHATYHSKKANTGTSAVAAAAAAVTTAAAV